MTDLTAAVSSENPKNHDPATRANGVAAPFTPYALATFVIALALRACHLWQLRASPFLSARLGDALAYDAWAREIAAGDWLGHAVFYQAPLYPYFLGVLYASLGDGPLVVRGVQCVLSAFSCALLASAGASLFSRGAGMAAGLLLATYAPSIFLDALLQKSVLDVFFICLALWLAARLARAPQRRLALALGLTTGLLALARENALILGGVLAAWLLTLPGVGRGRRLALAGVFAAGLAAALFPVGLRNWWVGGELQLTTSQLGPNLYIGNHPGAGGSYEPLRAGRGDAQFERQDATELAEAAAGRPLSPGEVSAYWTRRAIDYVLSHPVEWLQLMGRKLVLLLGALELVDSEDQYLTADYSIVLRVAGSFVHFGVLAPLAVLGAFVTWPRRRELWWIHAAVVSYAVSVLLFYVFARYRYPLVPFLALLAGAGLAGARAWAAACSRRELAACAALALGLTALSNGVSGMSKASMGAITYLNLATASRLEGKLELAAGYHRKALALDPELVGAAESRAGSLHALGLPEEDAQAHARGGGERERVLEPYRRALELDPGDAEARRKLAELEVELASALARRGDAAAALELYRSALALRPDAPAAMWGAAWILATQRDAALRRPAEAMALAERAAALSGPLTPSMLETLAAAYAAGGRMEQAIARAREALARYVSAGRPAPRRLTLALASYERGEPLRLPLRGPDAEGRGVPATEPHGPPDPPTG